MQKIATRIVLAKVGLDGHDRGVKVLARSLRDAGMEVIYTGLWQTPSAAAKAAIEEDADVLGVSFHSAAHMTLVPIVMQELKKLGRPDMPVAIGGIIPPDDVSFIKSTGVSAVFEPEVSMESIVNEINRLAGESRTRRAKEVDSKGLDRWVSDMAGGNRAALGRVLTWVENDAKANEIATRIAGPAQKTLVVGITGAPGVGKSTLIARLLKEFRNRDKTVAVVAVDPASPITGGALLGDRARMTASADDPGVFIRSSASRGELGGLAPTTGGMVHALTRAKIDVLIIETVGAGQNDYTVRQWAHPLVLLLMPGAGDELQLDKAGITEVANVFVINKADLPGADRLEQQIVETLGPKRPVVKTIASKGTGISELVDVLEKSN